LLCRKRRDYHAQEDPIKESLQRVQQGIADEQDALAQEKAVDEHEGVQRAGQLGEVHISGVDFNASKEDVLRTFRQFYREALSGAQPWYGMLVAWDIQRLSPDEAIEGVHLVPAKQKRFATQTHGGHGYVAVATGGVEQLLVEASKSPALNCTPPDLPKRRQQGVSVQKRRGHKKSVDVSSTRDLLGVSRVQMIDLDPREGFNLSNSHSWEEFPVSCLWEAEVSAVRT
jgi:hypothetical protein